MEKEKERDREIENKQRATERLRKKDRER